jgi:hypothetical protein
MSWDLLVVGQLDIKSAGNFYYSVLVLSPAYPPPPQKENHTRRLFGKGLLIEPT